LRAAPPQGEADAMTTLYAFILPLTILFCGLSIDVGRLELVKTQMQSATDAAALSAVQEAQRGTGQWQAVAQTVATANGFQNGANNVTVNSFPQPTFGEYANHYDALQTTISQSVKTLFMGALNGGYRTVSASGVALMTPCMYLTGSGQLQTYTLDIDTGDIDGDTCPVYINSEFTVTSYSNMNVEAISVAGSSGSSADAGETYPTPLYGVPTMADPLAYISKPTFSSCTYTSVSKSNTTATLSYGTYCKGLNFTNSTITLNPGLYIITGGATWSGSTVSGTGVTLFFTSGGGGTDSKFTIENSSTVTISAPTSSSNNSIPGILVFTDRTWTKTSNQDIALMTSSITGDGIWYAPETGIYVQNCTFAATHYLGIDANNVYTDGTNIQLSNNYTNLSGGNPFHTAGSLVE
jgi:Flp pilus assembly protein TadG